VLGETVLSRGLSICTLLLLGLTVKGLSLTVKGLSLAVRGLSLTVRGLSITVKGLGLTVRGLGLTVRGLGLTVKGLGLTLRRLSLTVKASRLDFCNNKGSVLFANLFFVKVALTAKTLVNLQFNAILVELLFTSLTLVF
jgi:hypothetical protein